MFKKGAFLAEKKLRPYILKYRHSTIDLAWDTTPLMPLLIHQMSYFCIQYCEVVRFPDFEPNEYLFETHKDKGETRWEIYAWAMRTIMMQ